MDIEITFEYGPITAKIHCEEDESYSEVMSDLAIFIENNEKIFGDVQREREGDESPQTPQNNDQKSGIEGTNLASLVENTDVTEETLNNIFEVGGEYPHLLVGEHITGSNNDQMEEGALLLLIVWEECFKKSGMTTNEIKEGLRNAGCPYENFYNIYQRQSFSQHFVKDVVERADGGTTSKISLTQPGRNRAYDRIAELADEMSST